MKNIVLSGISFGLFLKMVNLYSNNLPLIRLFNLDTLFLIGEGIVLFLFTWAGYSLMLSRASEADLIKTLREDSKTYLPFLLLLLYVFQFTPQLDGVNRYFASSYTQFGEMFFLLPAKLLFLFALSGVIFLKLIATDYWAKKIEEIFTPSTTKIVLATFMIIYFAVFTAMSVLQYTTYNTEWDLAVYDQSMWNTLQGRLLENTLELENANQENFASHFAVHNSPIFFLLIPIYALHPSPVTLLVVQTLALTSGALPVYWIARDKFKHEFAGLNNEFIGLIFAVSYLLYPSLQYINLFDFHEAAFTIPFLLFMFYYFQKKNFRNFAIFMFLALLCKEAVSLVVFAFGIYAMYVWRIREVSSKKWFAVPMSVSVIWFLFSFYVVIPYFNGSGVPSNFSLYYSHLGDNISEVALSIILHPIYTVKLMLTPVKLIYLLQLFLPFGFLSIFNPIMIVTFPTFLQNLLASEYSLYSINFQYTAELIPFITIGAIYTSSYLMYFIYHSFKKRFLYPFLTFILLLSLISTIIYGPSPIGAFFNGDKLVNDRADSADYILSKIPENEPVIAQVPYLAHLSHRRELYLVWDNTEIFEERKNVRYAVVDIDWTFEEVFEPVNYLINNQDWEVLYRKDSHILFRRKG